MKINNCVLLSGNVKLGFIEEEEEEEDVVPVASLALWMGRRSSNPRRRGASRRHPFRPRLGRNLHAGN